MGRFYAFGSGGNRGVRTVGAVLMLVGAVLLLVSVPSWLWASVLGILLISIGYLIWRFG